MKFAAGLFPPPFMGFLNLDQLHFAGMSHEFVGENQAAPFSRQIDIHASPQFIQTDLA